MSHLENHPAVLAGLAYPFLALQHPAPDAFDDATLAWVRRFQIAPADQLDRVERIICGTAARFGFFSAKEELVQLAADTIVWLFLFDDAYPEGRHRFDVTSGASGPHFHRNHRIPGPHLVSSGRFFARADSALKPQGQCAR